LKPIVNVETVSAAARARSRAIPVGVAESLLVVGELVHFAGDEGATAIASAAGVDEARVGRLGGCRTHSATRRLMGADFQLFGELR
jgi:hypothetical protein